ncbi:MAG TPA: hypothetical protein VN673_01685, partial [Clostridia bacterium]|nr:hypothetical protein [Clostridia bacterium]
MGKTRLTSRSTRPYLTDRMGLLRAIYFIAGICLAALASIASEPWDFSADFRFGVAADGHLSEVLERVRQAH